LNCMAAMAWRTAALESIEKGSRPHLHNRFLPYVTLKKNKILKGGNSVPSTNLSSGPRRMWHLVYPSIFFVTCSLSTELEGEPVAHML
jgi:hypothetical protein